MRVIAGTAKGRRLKAPDGTTTRPTADRVREAVFSSAQARVPGARVLDLYAGTGAMAIEALSRGAASAVLFECERPALEVIAANLDTADVADRATVRTARLPGALSGLTGAFDLVFCDPPYNLERNDLAEVLAGAARVLADDGTLRLEQSTHEPDPPWPPTLSPKQARRYGDTTIHVAVLQEA